MMNILEVISKAQRLKMSQRMKAKSATIAKKREIAMRKKASPEKLKKRAMKKARDILVKKILKDKDKSDLNLGQKEKVEKMLSKKKAVIKKIAKKLLPAVKKAEAERIKKRRENDK